MPRTPHANRAAAWGMIILILVILVAAGATAGFVILKNQTTIPTMTVTRAEITEAFYATGTVRPDRAYIIKSKAQGALVQMPIREGQLVKKGDILGQVDDKQLKFEVARQESELKMAQALAAEGLADSDAVIDSPQHKEIAARLKEAHQQLDLADAKVIRAQSNLSRGVGNQQELDDANKDHVQWSNTLTALESQIGTWRIQSQKNVEVAQANLRRAQADLDDAVIRSPIDGIVLERYAELGEVVGINQQLFLLADATDKVMKAAVDEEYMTQVTVGQQVVMKLYAMEKELRGKVVRWLPTANAANKTYEVTIAFDEPEPKLLVGMTAELNFLVGETHQGLVVPSTAIMENQAWKQTAPGKFTPVPVTLGVRTLEKYEITSGLSPGDQIVADAKQVAPIKLPEPIKPIVPTRKGDKPE